MLRHIRLFALGVLMSSAAIAAVGGGAQGVPGADAGSGARYSLVTERDPLLTVDGPVRFQPGDDPRWSDPGFDDSHWALVPGGRNWTEIGYKNLSGTAWYRFSVTLPAGEDRYAMRISYVSTCYQVFVDGRLMLTIGKMPPHAAVYMNYPEVVVFPVERRAVPQDVHVAMRVWESPAFVRYRPGGMNVPIDVGRADLVQDNYSHWKGTAHWYWSDLLDLGVLETIGGGVALAIYLLRRSEREYLWLFLLIFGTGGDHLLRVWAAFQVYPMHLVEGLESLCLVVAMVGSVLFYRELLDARWSPALRAVLLSAGLWFANTLLLNIPGYPVAWENAGELVFSLPVYAWILGLIFKRMWQGNPDARLLAAPVTLWTVSELAYQAAFTLYTVGHRAFAEFLERYTEFDRDFELTSKDIAEGIFLLAMVAILVNRFTRTRREQERIASELQAARSVQQVLVPETLPPTPGLAISAAYYPAEEVGGDFYQILSLRSGAVLLVIGDVAGKGLPAALTVSLMVGTLRTLVDYTESPAACLEGLNERLQGRGTGLATCLVMRFARDLGHVVVANAGHLAPYLNGDEVELEPGVLLGLDVDAEYAERRVGLRPGDHLAVLTDGVPEAMHARELFGFERTGAASVKGAEEIAAAARRFGQSDDITVLTVDVVGAGTTAAEEFEPVLSPV